MCSFKFYIKRFQLLYTWLKIYTSFIWVYIFNLCLDVQCVCGSETHRQNLYLRLQVLSGKCSKNPVDSDSASLWTRTSEHVKLQKKLSWHDAAQTSVFLNKSHSLVGKLQHYESVWRFFPTHCPQTTENQKWLHSKSPLNMKMREPGPLCAPCYWIRPWNC